MPRRSIAALTTLTPGPTPARLVPPEDMAEDARRIFLDLVLSSDAKHFQPSDLPLLCRYCQAHAMAERAAAALAKAETIANGDDAKVFVMMTKTASALALRLRLSPQARAPNTPKRTPPVSYYERLHLERGR